MIHFRFRGVRFVLPLLSIIAPLLAVKLGMQADFGALFLAMCIHETAHLCAAYLLKVNIAEVRLLPFGGSIRLENPYHIAPLKMAAISFAGPAANFLMILLFSTGMQWTLFSYETARTLIAPNIILFLFNLIPALPLDGGRILIALLTGFIGEKKALRAGIYCGRALAFVLIAATFASGIRTGTWNISFIFAAVFIISSERTELNALNDSRALRTQEALDGFDMREARIYQIEESHSISQALSLLRPKENAWFVITKSGCPHSLVDSRSLLRYVTAQASGEAMLTGVPSYRLCGLENNINYR